MDLYTILSRSNLVIFDMDGVLADTEPIYLEVEMELIGRYSGTLSPELIEKIKGTSLLRSMQMVLTELGIDENPEKLVEEEKNLLRQRFMNGSIDPVPCSMEVVDLLSSMGYRMALATSTERENTLMILSKLGIKDKFEYVITGDQVKETKPNPEIYLKVSKDMKVDPRNCLVIEDSLNGVKSARSAGMEVIAVNVQRKFKKSFLEFTPFIFNSMCEFLDELSKIRGVKYEKENDPF